MDSKDEEEIERIKRAKLQEMMRKASKKEEKQIFDRPVTVTDATFSKTIQSHTLVVIDCWAPWCGPCRMVGPIIEELARNYAGKILFGKLNVDENIEVATEYQIMSIPTLLVFKNGKLADRIIGAMPKNMLEQRITIASDALKADKMDEEPIREFLNKKNIIAVVGASRDPEKYGYRVYKDLREAGYKVYPVNPSADEILGDKCYSSLESLPVKPDVVDFVVPPKVTEETVRTCKRLGITKLWMQPGSESQTAIKFCVDNNIDVIHGICIMKERAKRQE